MFRRFFLCYLWIMFKKLFLSIFAIILVFEEWLWEVLTAFGRRLVVWLHLERLENWLRQAPPHTALVALLIPVIILTPVKLFALWMIANGIIIRGILLEIAAKLVSTVLIARVFALTKPQLLTIGWFNWLYHTIKIWLTWAHQRLQETAAYKNAKKLKATAREWVAMLKKRWWS